MLVVIMLLGVTLPVSGSLDTESDTYYVADDPSNYSLIECYPDEADSVSYNLETKSKTYHKVIENNNSFLQRENTQKYWPGHLPEGMTFDVNNYTTRDIFNGDSRIRVTNTNIVPYSRIVYLDVIATVDNVYAYHYPATGWMVSSNAVVTAAHAVYDSVEFKLTDGFCMSVTVIPGASYVEYNATSYTTDFPTTTVTNISNIYIPRNYELYEMPEYDYAVIILDDDIGNSTGWFSMSPSNDHSTTSASIIGYSKVKDNASPTPPSYMYHSVGAISHMNNVLYYSIDTDNGQSGSPIYSSSTSFVLGIHTDGANEDIPNYNSGVPINSTVYSFILGHLN